MINSYNTVGNIIKEINLITEYEMYDIICACNKTVGCGNCNKILRG
mgnify:CR=1 FL=1